MTFEQTTYLTMNEQSVECTLRILDGKLHLEADVLGGLSEKARKAWASKLGTVKRRFPELADFTEMVVESSSEAIAREQASQEVKAVKKTKKREATSETEQELAEVRKALQRGGISRAKLIRVLRSVRSPVSEAAIKQIL